MWVGAVAGAGCVRTSVPPYFSELTAGLQGQAGAAGTGLARLGAPSSVILETGEGEKDPDRTIGHQYMLFALPLTSVYFAEGVQRELDEVLLDALLERGNLVFGATPNDVEALQGILKPPPVLSAKLDSARLNAYDTFLFRILSVSGELTLEERSPGLPAAPLTQRISERSYRKFAYGPLLSYQFHKVVRSALGSLLDRREANQLYLGTRHAMRATAPSETPAQVLILLRPSVQGELPPDFGQMLADSSGYPNSLSYKPQAVLRLLQQGLREGTPSGSAVFDAASADRRLVLMHLQKDSFGSSPWIVQTEVALHLGKDEEGQPASLHSRAQFRVFEVLNGAETELFDSVCESEESLRRHEEGGAITALRRSLAGMAEALFRGQTETANVRCGLPEDGR